MTVTPHDRGTYLVSSESGREPYLVDLAWRENPWSKPVPTCGCWRCFCHGEFCKHLRRLVEFERERLNL